MVESHARSSRNRLSPGPLNRPSIETTENDTSWRIKATLRVPCRLLLGKRLDGFVDFVVSHEPVDTPANAPVLGDQNRHRELNQSSTFVSSCIVTKHNWIVHGLRRPANLKLLFLNEISASDELCVHVFSSIADDRRRCNWARRQVGRRSNRRPLIFLVVQLICWSPQRSVGRLIDWNRKAWEYRLIPPIKHGRGCARTVHA